MTKEEKKEYDRQRYLRNRDKLLEQTKLYQKRNKEKVKEYHDKYNKQYYRDNIVERKEYLKEYFKTKIGRASYLLKNYKREDRKHNRGECDLTPKWIVENVFSKSCHYCGENDWTKLGCDRIDNDKAHTVDNIVPCCAECNSRRQTKSYEEFKNEVQGLLDNSLL